MFQRRNPPCCSINSDTLSALIVILLTIVTSCAVWFTCRRLRKRRMHKEWRPYQPWDLASLCPCKEVEYATWIPLMPITIHSGHLPEACSHKTGLPAQAGDAEKGSLDTLAESPSPAYTAAFFISRPISSGKF